MASQGPFLPTQATQVVILGPGWTNQEAILASDNTEYATVDLPAEGVTDYLVGYNFGFSIPTDATIDGIHVEMDDAVPSGSVNASGGPSKNATSYAGLSKSISGLSGWQPLTDSSPTYLWATTWTPAEVNASTFSVILEAADGGFTGSMSVDAFRVTVYYTPVVTGQTAYPDADTDTTGWTTAPLFSKVDEPTTPSDTDFITGVAS